MLSRPETGLVRKIVPKIPIGNKKCMKWGYRYPKSEYRARFGLGKEGGLGVWGHKALVGKIWKCEYTVVILKYPQRPVLR